MNCLECDHFELCHVVSLNGPNQLLNYSSRHKLNIMLSEFSFILYQLNRPKKPCSRTKRRITPTLVKPQLSGRNVPNGSNVASSSNTFASHTPADLNKALQEDRKDIQREIVLRRKEQVTIKRRPVLIELHNGSHKGCNDCKGESPEVKQEEHQVMDKLESSSCLIADSNKLSMGAASRGEFVRSVINLETIDDLSVVYARVIRG